MLFYVEHTIPFVFNSESIHHIECQEGTSNMMLVLNDGTNRIISEETFKTILQFLEGEQQIIKI